MRFYVLTCSKTGTLNPLSSHRAFDVELLYIAQCFKIPIAEVAVNWTEIEGTTFFSLSMKYVSSHHATYLEGYKYLCRVCLEVCLWLIAFIFRPFVIIENCRHL